MTPPRQIERTGEFSDKVVVKINGETFATVEPGTKLGEAVAQQAQGANLRSFAVLLNRVKQNNGPESRGVILNAGDEIELIAKDTRGFSTSYGCLD